MSRSEAPLHRRPLAAAAGGVAAGVGGADRGQRVILAHGFTQNADCWGEFGRRLATTAEVIAVDLPGHGRSHHDDADLTESARLLIEAGGTGVYLGYSMGGRVAIHAALDQPGQVTGLILIGATAGIDDASERAARRAADDALAERLLADGLPAFLDRWLAGPLFAGLSDEQAAKTERSTNRAEGLAASLRRCGTGTQQPLWDRLAELRMPVTVVVGSDDRKFSALGARLVTAMTGTTAELVSIPGTHAVHLEQPELTAKAIAARLDRLNGTGR